MPAAWSSNNPEVLAWWDDVLRRRKAYSRECRKVEKETGRKIIIRTGFGDEYPIGLTSKYNEEPPPGWKYGQGDRFKGFIEPRIRPRKGEKEDCEKAEALMKRLVDKHPAVRRELREKFGMPTHHFIGGHIVSPGIALLNGRLWVSFGEYDIELPKNSTVPKFFRAEKLSAYHRAREKDEEAAAS